MKFSVKEIINPVNLYLANWCLYYLQGVLYPLGAPLGKVFLFIGIVMSIYYWVKAFQEIKIPKFLISLSNFTIFLVLYAILMIVSGDVEYRSNDRFAYTGIRYLNSFISSIPPVFTCYYFARKGMLLEKQLKMWFFVFLLTATGTFFQYETTRMLNSKYDNDGLTNNIAYHFVTIIPMLLLFRKNLLLMYSALAYIGFFILFGMKRGAIFIALFCFAYIFKLTMKNTSRGKKVIAFIVTIVVIILCLRYVEYMMVNSDYFNYRLEQTLEGDSSNRSDYFNLFWNYFTTEATSIDMLFGGGAYTTVRINGNLAHNDWFEILINNGILGLFLYILYWLKFAKYLYLNKNSQYFSILLMFFCIFFMKTLFSMSYSSIVIYASVCLGYAVAKNENNKKISVEP